MAVSFGSITHSIGGVAGIAQCQRALLNIDLKAFLAGKSSGL
jgi:hypothetical protein